MKFEINHILAERVNVVNSEPKIKKTLMSALENSQINITDFTIIDVDFLGHIGYVENIQTEKIQTA